MDTDSKCPSTFDCRGRHSRFWGVLSVAGALALSAAAADGVTNRTEPTTQSATKLVSVGTQAQQAERLRAECVEGRRYVAGRVLEVTPQGLVVDSGYSALLSPPLNQSWVVKGNVTVTRDPNAVEEKHPDAVCIGPVFLGDFPKRPAVKAFDYVVIHAYPAGEQTYQPVPGVEKTLRRYCASLERAVDSKMKSR
ncbi:MAG TPA: hypothetical protein VMF06_01730 [Candidatus Limnocylindria bacterium]|nr:hypothetical protein [Candidatus Limnocylindria bacterium]